MRRDNERAEFDSAIASGTESGKNCGGEAVMAAALVGLLVEIGLSARSSSAKEIVHC